MFFHSNHMFVIGKVYFFLSLTFIMARGTATFMFATKIYENSRKPLKVIRSISEKSWNSEAKRLRDQIVDDVNALTGMNFFHLTRDVLLSLVGTITTYELFLLQDHDTEAVRNATVTC